MFISYIKIKSYGKIIREMYFRKGINLIIDETPINETDRIDDKTKTGNNVGKTTVLKLIDFCLGAKGNIIYSDAEASKQTYGLVKEYLINNEVIVELELVEDLEEENSYRVLIERNFLLRNKAIRRINGKQIPDSEFEEKLKKLLIPSHNLNKPTFRQIISHNIRYKDNSINNTLKNLDKFTSDAEYETLYLFLLGCTFEDGEEKQVILSKIRQESLYKERLEKKQTKTTYEAALSIINDEIAVLNEKKSKLNINENFEEDLEKLNTINSKINRISSDVSNLKIRRDLILESKEELEKGICNIDLQQLRIIYQQAMDNLNKVQKTFEELVKYHNTMITEKMKFIEKDLPQLEKEINDKTNDLNILLKQEIELSEIVARSDSFKALEKLIGIINEKYREKGEYENIISQINEVEHNISDYNKKLKKLDKKIFSKDFEEKVKNQINKFNKYFSSVSNELYGEKYAIKYDIVENKNNQLLYKFNSFNANLSSGKKQGEILCYDISYILFADSEEIPCLHFILNDKKELMHGNQLIKVSEYIKDKNIQLIISILKDKLPEEMRDEKYYVVKLSQNDKLFRIENKNK